MTEQTKTDAARLEALAKAFDAEARKHPRNSEMRCHLLTESTRLWVARDEFAKGSKSQGKSARQVMARTACLSPHRPFATRAQR